MLADGLTKDQMDPADLLRSALHVGEYQLHAEASILDQKMRMRDERDLRSSEVQANANRVTAARTETPTNVSQFSATIR